MTAPGIELANDPWSYFWSLGWRRLIPIRPRDKRPADEHWTDIVATELHLDVWRELDRGVGVLGGHEVCAVDMDCYAEADAAIARPIIERYLPNGPLRVGQAPKGLFVFRPVGVVPYSKMEFGEKVLNGDGRAHRPRIEIIARGKQFVAWGIHPVTERPYAWIRPPVALDALPALDAAGVARMMDELREALRGDPVTSVSALAAAPAQESLRGDPAAVARAVRAIPNSGPAWASREAYIEMGYAIKAALGDDATALELFQEWCARWTDGLNDPEIVRADFERMTGEFRRGASWLREVAANNGLPLAVQWSDEFEETPKPDAVSGGRAPEAAAAPKTWPTPYSFPDPTKIPTRQSLYGGHYVRKWVSSTIAPSKVGKSSLVLVEALAMASGKPLLGIQPREPCRVWWWNGEDPQDELDRRTAAAIQHYGLTAADLGGRLMIDSGRDTMLTLAGMGKFGAVLNEELLKEVTRRILENRIDASIFDPLISLHRISENDNNGIDLFAKRLNRMANETNSAIELPHHTRKLYGGGATVEDGRGASALLATTRSTRALARMTKEEALRSGVPNATRVRLLRFADVSSNIQLPDSEIEDKWFELKSAALGNGGGDDLDRFIDGDSVGVLTIWTPPAADVAPEPGEADREAAALEAVRRQDCRRDSRANDWVGVPLALALGVDRETVEGAARIKNIIRSWLKSGKLVEEIRLDAQRRARTYVVAPVQNVKNSEFDSDLEWLK